MINRPATLERLRKDIDKIIECSRVLDSDGDIDDMGAAEHIGEFNLLIEAIEANEPDSEIEKINDDLCITRLVYL